MPSHSGLSGIKGGDAVLIKAATCMMLALRLLPIITVLIISFAPADTIQFPPPDFSLRWYAAPGT